MSTNQIFTGVNSEDWFHLLGPRSARRVPQPHREYSSEPVFEPEARSVRPASWRAPGGARNARSFRALRAAFSFVAFFWPNKRKPPRVQGRSHPQIAFEIARKARDTFKNLDSRLRGNDGIKNSAIHPSSYPSPARGEGITPYLDPRLRRDDTQTTRVT